MEDRDEGPVSQHCSKHPCTVTRFFTGGTGIRKRDVNSEWVLLVLCHAVLYRQTGWDPSSLPLRLL